MDRGYIDFERLARPDAGAFFVIYAKSNVKTQRRYSRRVDRASGLICDQAVVLTGYYSRQGFQKPLRRMKFNDPQTVKRLVFVPNNFALDSSPSPSSTDDAGSWSCSSSGSSSTCASKDSSALPKTPSNRKSGSPSQSTSWLPSLEEAPRARGEPLRNPEHD
jgi:hypothetical protein